MNKTGNNIISQTSQNTQDKIKKILLEDKRYKGGWPTTVDPRQFRQNANDVLHKIAQKAKYSKNLFSSKGEYKSFNKEIVKLIKNVSSGWFIKIVDQDELKESLRAYINSRYDEPCEKRDREIDGVLGQDYYIGLRGQKEEIVKSL